MADALNAGEVRDIVLALENDTDHRLMREAMKERHNEIQMLNVPDLAEHMTRGIGVSIPTPLLIWLATNIAADILPYPTITTITPFGLTKPMQEAADKLEKWVSLWRVRADPARTRTSDVRDNQLLSSYAVMMLRCGSPDDEYPWSVETPNPETCFFPIEKAPFRPTVFGRRYKQLVRKVQKQYSNRKNWDGKGWEPNGLNLNWSGKGKSGKFSWEPVGDERPNNTASSRSEAGPFEDCEMMELHIEDMVYILAMNASGKDGEIVWTGKSMTGGVSAVVIPGRYSAVGPMSERLQPVLWPAIQMVHLINRVRAMRATRAEQQKPDVLVEQTPEQQQLQQVAGTIAQGENAALEAGGPNIINVRGKPTLWTVQDNPDLDKLETSLWTELNRYISAMTEVSDPEVVKDATANAFLTNLESRKRQRAPMLAHLDWGWNELAKMAIYSITEYDKEFELYSIQGNEHAEMKKGEAETIGPKDLLQNGESEWYWIETETKSTTEAEARMRVQDWAYRKGLGLSEQSEGITAAGYTDETQQYEKLAIDQAFMKIAPFVMTMALQSMNEEVLLSAGIDLGLAPPQIPTQLPPEVQPAGGAGGAPTNGLQPMPTAAVPGPAGGSGGLA